jgi:HAAS
VADDGVIDAYLDELWAKMRWHRDVADIVAEADDHLRSTIDALIASGVDDADAPHEAIARFGDPAIVARACATTRRGRLAVPTSSTRQAGVLGVVSGSLWLVYPLVWLIGGLLYDRVGPTNPGDELGSPAQLGVVLVMGMTLLGAACSMLVVVFVLAQRHGGFGAPGALGMVAGGIGVGAAVFGWFYLGWASALMVATALVSVELLRGGLAPRMWVLATGCGLTAGGAVWGVLRFARVGSTDQHGEFLVANAVGLAVGCVILGGGLIGLGRWLGSEDPIELAEVDRPHGVGPIGSATT